MLHMVLCCNHVLALTKWQVRLWKCCHWSQGKMLQFYSIGQICQQHDVCKPEVLSGHLRVTNCLIKKQFKPEPDMSHAASSKGGLNEKMHHKENWITTRTQHWAAMPSHDQGHNNSGTLHLRGHGIPLAYTRYLLQKRHTWTTIFTNSKMLKATLHSSSLIIHTSSSPRQSSHLSSTRRQVFNRRRWRRRCRLTFLFWHLLLWFFLHGWNVLIWFPSPSKPVVFLPSPLHGPLFIWSNPTTRPTASTAWCRLFCYRHCNYSSGWDEQRATAVWKHMFAQSLQLSAHISPRWHNSHDSVHR